MNTEHLCSLLYRTCKILELPMNLVVSALYVTEGGSIDVYCLVHHGSSTSMLGNAYSKPWSVSPLENASSVFIAILFDKSSRSQLMYIRFKFSCLGAHLKRFWSLVEASWSICLCTWNDGDLSTDIVLGLTERTFFRKVAAKCGLGRILT